MIPHGMFPLGLPMLSSIQNEIFPEFAPPYGKPEGIQTAVANVILAIPLLSLMLRWLNCTYATRTHLEECLSQGNVIIIPDGIAGMYHTNCEEERVYLSTRHGFIKAAMEQGSLLVPCFWFGHSQLWAVWPKHDSWLAALSRRLRFSLIWFWGVWWMPPLPQRVPLTLVVGRGIPCEKIANPTKEQVSAKHAEFTKALSTLYYQYRMVAPEWNPKKPLLIV
jgi:2-acylglycerol O-acyltransferase 2